MQAWAVRGQDEPAGAMPDQICVPQVRVGLAHACAVMLNHAAEGKLQPVTPHNGPTAPQHFLMSNLNPTCCTQRCECSPAPRTMCRSDVKAV